MEMDINQKEAILTGAAGEGGYAPEAIDGGKVKMPSSGYEFRESAGRVEVYYEKIFRCYDGWDSTFYLVDDTFSSKQEAIEAIWHLETQL